MMIYEEIFRRFQKGKVKYVIVGGIAVNLLGSLRSTADLDILVEMDNSNLKKIIHILTKLGYRVKQPVDPMGIAKQEIREDWIKNKNMKAFNFYKGDGLEEVDIIIDSPVSYKEAKKSSKRIKSGSLILPVISLEDIIKMKRESGRDIDRLDINELKIIRKFKRNDKN